ncbi:MAG: ABC transporter substrate-binding protein [Rhodospirillaceae bacterium]|nr:ABC transporter substrate-binding protein [Rhodospirillaceae bacterium]
MARRLAAFAFGALAVFAAAPALAEETLVIGMSLEPPHLDPTAGAAGAIDEVVYANLFESLTRIDETGQVIPGLAESWTVSDDGLTYTFRLRQGVLFHDGTTFDADDVRFSLERAAAEDSVNAQKAFFTPIASIDTPAPDQVVVHLDHPVGLFLFTMGSGDAAIVAPESAASNTTNPVGTGPYRFAGRAEGDHVTLERNPDYHGPDSVFFDRVVFRFISDPAAQVAALLAGDVAAIPNIAAPEAMARFEADDRFAVDVGTTEGETILAVNHRRPPFDDVRVRRALAHAVDRQAIVDAAMFGYGTPIGSHFAPHNPAYVDLTGVYPHDPERARALLAEAGYPDGFEATIKLPPPSYARRGGEVIQAQLAEIGVRVTLEPVEWAQWLEQAFRGFDYDMTIVSHTEPLDIGIYARGDDYYFGYHSDAFDAVIAELDATADPDARNRLYDEAQRLLADDEAAVFLFQLAKTGVREARLQGLWVNSPIQANDVTAARWGE